MTTQNLQSMELGAKIAETALSKANRYIQRIRNHRKQEYAAAYLGFLTGLLDHEPVSKDYQLSYMAAQGVRRQLNVILDIGGQHASDPLREVSYETWKRQGN